MTISWRARLTAWLESPRLPVHLALLAVLLGLPSLGIGWQFDDHFHRLMMVGGRGIEPRPMEVFSSLMGGPAVIRHWVDVGVLPWWTSAQFRLSFFRPLSAITMWLDYRLWPDTPALMHLHSLLWYGALVWIAAALYRRWLGAGWCSGLAALLYAIDEAHALPAAWLANRNGLQAACFGMACLWAYDRWRRDGWRPGAAAAPLLLAAGLASGEMAVAVAGWLGAYALFVDRAAWRSRLASLAPCAVTFLAWAVTYRLLGYGAYGSDFYQDPMTRPIAFLAALAARAPVLMLGQWTPIAADWSTFLPKEDAPWLIAAGVVTTLVVAYLVVPLLRRDRLARFFAAGMLVSLVPIAAVSPSNRLLFFVGLGAMGLMAQFARQVVERGRRSVLARIMLAALALAHLVFAPLYFPVNAWTLKPLGDPMIEAIATVPDDPPIAGQDLVLVNPPDYLYLVSHIVTVKALQGKPYPRRLLVLASGTSPVELRRLGPASIRVRVPDGLFTGTLGRLFRSRRDPMSPGQRLDTSAMAITIVETNAEGDPVTIDYTLPAVLEDPSLRWLLWDGKRYVPFTPPALDAPVTLPPSYGPMDFFRR